MEKKTEQAAVEVFHLGGGPIETEFHIERGADYIKVDAVSDALFPVQDFIYEHLVHCGFNEKVCSEIRLAVEEIFINICSYAYRPDHAETWISCRVVEHETYILLQFTDSGIPFDPLKKEAVDVTGKQFVEHEGGFGIHLVKKMMDEVSYEYRDGMNVLKVKRFLD